MTPVGPDLTKNTYYIDRQSEEYASALRKNAYNGANGMTHQMGVSQLSPHSLHGSGSLSSSPVPSLQPLTISLANSHSGLNNVNYIHNYNQSLSVSNRMSATLLRILDIAKTDPIIPFIATLTSNGHTIWWSVSASSAATQESGLTEPDVVILAGDQRRAGAHNRTDRSLSIGFI